MRRLPGQRERYDKGGMNMAMMMKYKVKEVATDLNVTTKEVVTV